MSSACSAVSLPAAGKSHAQSPAAATPAARIESEGEGRAPSGRSESPTLSSAARATQSIVARETFAAGTTIATNIA